MASANKDSSSMGVGECTPLATKLQQVWLQSQLPKVGKNRKPSSFSSSSSSSSSSAAAAASMLFRTATSTEAPNQTNTDLASPTTTTTRKSSAALFTPGPAKQLVPPMLRSYSIKESSICNHHGSSSSPFTSESPSSSSTSSVVGEFSEFGEPMAPLTTFLDDMLMEEDINNTWCMDQESNASYLAMEKSFADLIDEVPAIPSDDSSNMFEDKEKGVWAVKKHYNNNHNNNASSNDPLNFTELSEDIFEDRVLNEVTDLLSQQLGQMCLSLESSTCINSSSGGKIAAMANSTAYYMDPILSVPQVATVSSNRPHEMMTMGMGASMHHHFLQHGTTPAVAAAAGLQHDLQFAFETGAEDELIDLLIRCAEAIGQNDVRMASQLIAELRECSSPSGSGAQRMAHYVTDALVAKMSGIGAQLCITLQNTAPSFGTVVRAYKSLMDCVPFKQITIFISSVLTLNAFKGATRVHLVAYGITYVHWPFIIQQLALQPEGPPHVRITGVVRPGDKPPVQIEKIRRKLSDLAKFWGVPFEYSTVVDNWENVTSAHLPLRHDEVLVVHCNFRNSHLLDESIMTTDPRKLVLDRIRTMNPKILITEVANASCNEPFFMSRFLGTVKYFSTRFDMVDVLMLPDDPSRQLVERYLDAKEIVNIVACEGLERFERTEPYWQWQRRIQRAGFRPKPLHFSIVSAIKSMLGSYNKHFGIGEDGGWFLTGWKNEVLIAMSMWEPVSTWHGAYV